MKRSLFFTLLLVLSLGIIACDDSNNSNTNNVNNSNNTNNTNNVNNTNNTNNVNNVTCGDSIVEGTEVCDSTNLNGNNCTTIGQGFTGGTLACDSSCAFDTSNCDMTQPTCGDGVVEGSEACDATNLNGKTCITEGHTGGTLSCDSSCVLDESNCTDNTPTCGDGVVEGTEACDATNLNGNTCVSLGHTGGTLSCDSSCVLDESNCTDGTSTCGDGVVEGSEVCDGTNLNGESCTTKGYTGGALYCNSNCDGFNMGGCRNYGSFTCGDGVKDPDEQCDGTDIGTVTCSGSFGMDGGTVTCNSDCTLNLSQCTGDMCANNSYYNDGWCDPCELYGGTVDATDCHDICTVSDGSCGGESYFVGLAGTTSCILETGQEDPDCTTTCGDNVWDDDLLDQSCDGTDLQGADCTNLGFAGGTLACSDNCTFDLTNCDYGTCGDNIIVQDEVCDGTNLNGEDCTTIGMGFNGGVLACDANCGWDTSACTMPVCGDGLIEGGEVCDGTDLDGNDCSTIPGFVSGTLACDATTCQWDTSNCVGLTCNATDLGTFNGTAISLAGDMCADGVSNYYSPPGYGNTCTGWSANGAEKLFQIVVNAGDTINIDWYTSFDNSLYLITDCLDTVADTCLAGADDTGTGASEVVSYTNSTGAPVTVFIVGDIYSSSADCSSAIAYTLDIN